MMIVLKNQVNADESFMGFLTIQFEGQVGGPLGFC